MRHLIALSLLSLTLTVAPRLAANSVTLYVSPFSYGGGGESTAVTDPSFLGNYSSVAIETSPGGTGFQTFCVEEAVDASPATLYSFTLGQTTSQGQQLSLGAAYLYWLFASGSFNGVTTPYYNYANVGGTRSIDAELMQSALWVLMGEPNYFGQDMSADPYYQFVVATFGLGGAFGPNNGNYPVQIMQLWDYNDTGSPAPYGYQAQLVLNLPDGGSPVLMLGGVFSLLGLVGLRARKPLR